MSIEQVVNVVDHLFLGTCFAFLNTNRSIKMHNKTDQLLLDPTRPKTLHKCTGKSFTQRINTLVTFHLEQRSIVRLLLVLGRDLSVSRIRRDNSPDLERSVSASNRTHGKIAAASFQTTNIHDVSAMARIRLARRVLDDTWIVLQTQEAKVVRREYQPTLSVDVHSIDVGTVSIRRPNTHHTEP
jgi:hypothetical protein